jgi:hypothetical protein
MHASCLSAYLSVCLKMFLLYPCLPVVVFMSLVSMPAYRSIHVYCLSACLSFYSCLLSLCLLIVLFMSLVSLPACRSVDVSCLPSCLSLCAYLLSPFFPGVRYIPAIYLPACYSWMSCIPVLKHCRGRSHEHSNMLQVENLPSRGSFTFD